MNHSLSTQSTTAAGWRWAVFRFCFVYFSLFCLFTTVIPFALLGLLGRWVHRLGGEWAVAPADPITGWVGRTVFGVDAVLHRDSGAGDQTANWVLVFCILVVAVVAAAVWTVVDRRTAHPRSWAWFTLFLRLCLGAVMVGFGVAKLIPTQMPGPTLAQLLQPYGDLSPASVLWLQVGGSHPYEMALGAAEVVAGLLLFVPRTAVLGALSSVLCMAQVLLLNLTFDIPEKLLSGHLLLIGLILLAPYCARLIDLFVRQRPCRPLTPPPLFTDVRKNRKAVWFQLAVAFWVVLGGYDRWLVWQEQYGPDSPKSELYGIWEVREFTLDGQPTPPLTTDENRWQRLVFDDPAEATYQRMNGELVAVRAEFRPDGRVIFSDDTIQPFATLSVERPVPDRLSLRGTLRGRPITVTLERVDLNSFTLNSRGFHWVQDYPYFR
ncbi:DoxX family protein [Nocardia otitidiscaviarum]|uniref:DoxX family protein n=1 Tax=Nocardia otitidiscaviarum TaxID=1823 RepID=A0A516NNE8_9NOCA|nr:DoxX family protein [Nocardia otitidiscaviarum]MCP9624355.1 DoxX family protein [Nocardia otitidiscaviarum]QDP80421.1 DoxX family protein [Nocardia otitidiscaviarum]